MPPDQPTDGGPAFPVLAEVNCKEVIGSDGISMRDYFAAAALPDLIRYTLERDSSVSGDELHLASRISQRAYVIADAMLRERGQS